VSAPEAAGIFARLIRVIVVVLVFQMETDPVHLFEGVVVLGVLDDRLVAAFTKFCQLCSILQIR